MKTPPKREPDQKERKNVDIERGGLDESGDQERPRKQNRRARGPVNNRSSGRKRGRSLTRGRSGRSNVDTRSCRDLSTIPRTFFLDAGHAFCFLVRGPASSLHVRAALHLRNYMGIGLAIRTLGNVISIIACVDHR